MISRNLQLGTSECEMESRISDGIDWRVASYICILAAIFNPTGKHDKEQRNLTFTEYFS